MSSKSPVFTMLEPHHFSDYGFDPQIDYFQVLEEARKHKREATRSIDTLHFKLQKPISKDDPKKCSKKRRHQWWWKNALLFFKTKWAAQHKRPSPIDYHNHHQPCRGGSISGPIYFTEYSSGSQSTSPCRTTTRPTSGPIAGTLTPTRKGDLEIPYISLKDLNMDLDPPPHVISSTPMPIYLVT
ncbi:uncharacterized protein LOC104906525 [Beta vulgaris subsp. vulgaris]|uniref:uncharacterized protein LOC104906525 n=1 Tax=Beta vulgaris subsp. vulgaris TaxID=3555 RepID=UPI002036D39D|nr:uncharacterized protein LOC104906525 [Beta vulgaris subsp. vulgaris]